jgi:hypothetical protein
MAVSGRTLGTCPFCGENIDGYQCANGAAHPGNGDVFVCFYCGEAGVYVASPWQLSIRRPYPAEEEEMRNNAELRLIQAAIRFNGRKG